MRSLEEIKGMIQFAREQGVESLEVDGIKYGLGKIIPFQKPQVVEELKAEEIIAPLSPLDELSEEEILYWSTPFFDEIQRKKEEMRNKKLEDDELRKTAAN